MDRNKIGIGDVVSVTFPDAEEGWFPNEGWFPKLEVLYIPSETGDCWHMRNPDNGQIHYIQHFETISLMEKKV